jgi:hypothetical protein
MGALALSLAVGSAGCSSSTTDTGSGNPPPGGGGPGVDSGAGSDAAGPGTNPDGGTTPGNDAGAGHDSGGGHCTTPTGPITGSVGATGGSVSRLLFGVVGDTRPVNEDDPSTYPTSVITKIFQDLEAQSPRPSFAVATGDYQFSSTGSNSTAREQIGTYMQARASFTSTLFPALGNHDCGVSGPYTTSDDANCGPGNPGGATPNYNEFMGQMLGPISKTTPYYSFNVNATDNSWTAKFVVTAANSWDSSQQSWLDSTLAQPTTYTFVVRHQASDAFPPLPPGVAGVDAALAQHPYTLLIVGHAHTYGHYRCAPQVAVIGNGGAPLSSKNYGYALFSQRCDGAIVADEYDYMTGATDSQFHFVITPQGTITQ